MVSLQAYSGVTSPRTDMRGGYCSLAGPAYRPAVSATLFYLLHKPIHTIQTFMVFGICIDNSYDIVILCRRYVETYFIISLFAHEYGNTKKTKQDTEH